MFLGKGWHLGIRPFVLRRLLPDFLVIGAMKSGTNSLHDYLNGHPDIFMPPIRESCLFMNEDDVFRHWHGLSNDQILAKWSHSYRGQRLIGESPTAYTRMPEHGTEVPANVRAVRPDMKFVYMIRNPLERVISHYYHHIRHGYIPEDVDIETFLLQTDQPLDISLYYSQLLNYLEIFPAEQFRVLLLEEFILDPVPRVRELFGFLGVNDQVEFPQLFRKLNENPVKRKIASAKLKLAPATWQRLMERISEDKAGLEGFLGRTIECWDLSEDFWCTGIPTAQVP